MPNLIDLLRSRAEQSGDAVPYVFVEGDQRTSLSYAQLDAKARAIAATLQAGGHAGKRALLLYPPGLEYIAGFFGCLYAGVTAVPAFPPDPFRLSKTLPRVLALVKDADPGLCLTTEVLRGLGEGIAQDTPALGRLPWLATDAISESVGGDWIEAVIPDHALAFLQYTSGSTSTPKGVRLTHGNLTRNLETITQGMQPFAGETAAIWLPPYHDMGLIGGILETLFADLRVTLMAPRTFLQAPLQWLKIISERRCVIAGGPNFAFDYCVRKVSGEQAAGLDLSSWRVAFCGAEPIRAETLERFARTFAPSGFTPRGFYPCYGLAEATLYVTGPAPQSELVVDRIDASALAAGRRVVVATGGRRLVGVGRPGAGVDVDIVDPSTRRRTPAGHVGEIWVRGTGVADGYWRRPDETTATFGARLSDSEEGPFLRTGDLGYVTADAQLFVTGRLKDLILLRGQNHYPQDIELTVEQAHAALRPGCSVCFSVEHAAEERLVAVAEIQRAHLGSVASGLGAELSAKLRHDIASEHGISLWDLLLVEPGAVSKTSSGKLQRHACREAYLAGTLQSLVSFRGVPEIAAHPEVSSVSFEFIRRKVAALLELAPEQLDPERPLAEFGMDSIRAIETITAIREEFGAEIPFEVLIDGTSLIGLARRVREGGGVPAAQHPPSPAPVRSARRLSVPPAARCQPSGPAMSLFYFASEAGGSGDDPYRLLLEGARFADQHGFQAVWIPERHLHAFGGIFPNPSVLGAALAMSTENIRIRAGSVVLPLHSPLRVAEEWSVVDNLSRGRVDVAFASGWNVRDFVVRPEGYAARKTGLLDAVATVRSLWRGEAVSLAGVGGEMVSAKLHPVPVQSELPFWITVSSAPASFELAGRSGGNLLTHLLFFSVEELAERIALYRRARAAAGFDPATGQITLMLHTHVGSSDAEVKQRVRQPLIRYLASSAELWAAQSDSLRQWTDAQRLEAATFAFERYYERSGLFGSSGRCLARLRELLTLGVNEFACLIDFGIDFDATMEGLRHLDHLRVACQQLEPVRNEPTPLSFAQERMWFLQELEPHSAAYNDLLAINIEGPLEIAALDHALARIIQRHPVLGARFPARDGLPLQVQPLEAGIALKIVDASGLSAAALAERARATAQRPFKLEAEPPLRAVLLRVDSATHLLVLVVHHIATDAASARLLFKELTETIATPANSSLPDTTPYTTFAARQRANVAELDAKTTYWREHLRGPLVPLSLATDRDRRVIPSRRGVRVPVRIDAVTAARLKSLARAEGATPFMTLLAAFQAYLRRCSGQSDVTVGCPIEGRQKSEYLSTIGCFTNTLALRVTLDGDPTFRELLRATRRVALDGYAHAEVPFERVAHALQIPRGLGPMPIFQTMFVLQAPYPGPATVGGVRLLPALLDPGTSKADLRLELVDEGEGFGGYLEADHDLFEPPSVDRMAVHLVRLIEQAAREPDLALSTLELSDPAEREWLIHTVNQTEANHSLDQTVDGLVADQAARTPHAIALSCRSRCLTYEQLELQANALAEKLLAAGAEPGGIVALLARRSIEQVVAQLAIMKVGCAFLPLDPDHPRERTISIIDDAHPAFMLAPPSLLDGGVSVTVPVLPLMLLETTPTTQRVFTSASTPDQFAYVLYTSGSTGGPKGVPLRHRGVVNRLLWSQHELPLHPSDSVLQKTAPTFDVSVWETFAPLISGARLETLPSPEERDPVALIAAIATSGVTVMHFVPSMLASFLESVVARAESGLCTRLRRVHCSGEVLTAALQDRFFEVFPGCSLINLYGPTEASIDVTWWTCAPGNTRVPIGRPIANVHLYIVDQHLRLVPLGTAGELAIGGVAIAPGYLNRPELTAALFIDNPFGDGKVYRTGDRVRMRHDGAIEFLGRMDHQVKIRGFRVELGEIESVLCEHPGIESAVVALGKARSGAEQLRAWFVPRPNESPTARELRGFLTQKLPGYMVPGAMMSMAAFPILPSGKIDRRALPEPIEAATSSPVAATTLEWEVTAAFREVLGRNHVGPSDDFFDLGGHSLLGARLIVRLRATLGVELPLRLLFQAPTVHGLCALIEHMTARGALPSESRIALTREELEHEAQLDPSIAPRQPVRAGPLAEVLLTGATGFVGAFLLRDLLRSTQARIHCLVRATDAAAAAQRVRANLESHGLWEERHIGRIVPIVGDLALPRLGLTATQWAELEDRIDGIFHNGAHVDHARLFRALRAANVGGTAELLRLAAAGRPKPFHFVSTLSIFESPSYDARHSITELDEATDPLCHDSYAQTKRAAEMLTLAAGRRGLPITVHRLGMCTGDTVLGAGGLTGIFARFITGVIEMGVAPDMDLDTWLVPVDYVSQALVQLALSPDPPRVSHLVAPEPVPYAALISAIRDAGFPLDTISYERWLARARATLHADHPLYPLTAFLTTDLIALYGRQARAHLSSARTAAALAGHSLPSSQVSPTLIAMYLQRWREEARLASDRGHDADGASIARGVAPVQHL